MYGLDLDISKLLLIVKKSINWGIFLHQLAGNTMLVVSISSSSTTTDRWNSLRCGKSFQTNALIQFSTVCRWSSETASFCALNTMSNDVCIFTLFTHNLPTVCDSPLSDLSITNHIWFDFFCYKIKNYAFFTMYMNRVILAGWWMAGC